MAVLKDLIVHGSSRFLNKIYASQIQAEEGHFNKLMAKDLQAGKATVIGLLDVKGQMHTNSWTNSNMATINGSFYITPTITIQQGTAGNVAVTSNQLSFSGTTYTVNSLYLDSGAVNSWPVNSKVLVTGEILNSNDEWIPLGTLLGTLSTYSDNSIIIAGLLDKKNQPSNILAELVTTGISSTKPNYRNIMISLYERYNSSNYYPIGIYMTATGQNGKTFLDIYGGGQIKASSPNHGGLAKPNVRIGNLEGLQSVGGITPSGWGIYTTHGFFEGTIAASSGVIGGWTIGSDNIHNGITGVTTTGTTTGTFIGTGGISNYLNTNTYVNIQNGVITAKGANIKGALTATSLSTGTKTASTTGNGFYVDSSGNIYVGNGSTNNFQVTAAGSLTAKTGTIGGITLNSSYGLYSNSKTSATSTNTGFLIHKDGAIYLGAYNSTTQNTPFQVTSAGVLTARSGTVGGWTLDSGSLSTGTLGSSGGILISTNNSTSYTINGNTVENLRLMIGNKFGVDSSGVLYTDGANIINIDAQNIAVGTIALGILPSEVKNENIVINGRNLIANSYGDRKTPASVSGGVYVESYPILTEYGFSILDNTDDYFTYSFDYFVTGNSATNAYIYAQAKGTQIVPNLNQNIYNSPQGHYEVTFQLTSTQVSSTYNHMKIRLMNATDGAILTVRNIKLQLGNRSTYWTSAPEDTQSLATQLNIANDNISGLQTTSALIPGIQQDLDAVQTGLGEVQEDNLTINGTLNESVLPNLINVEDSITNINTNISEVQGDIGNLQTTLTAVQADVITNSQNLGPVLNWLEIDETGITIGKKGTQNATLAKFTSEQLSFTINGNTVAYIKVDDGVGKLFSTTSMVLDDLRFGHWAWAERENGNMTLRYVADEIV